ncbi:hypothetical protein DPMN_086543 [Dreissena polymorpha]|uniref:Uncharacterized protein n=1 Tax=Dreissena polymorpha TaxID=45954 RepID=A0A9D4KSI1_DREPO|nr:hypothetical protein DPMN_086543 [Dreissena polymorpha]
MHTIHGTTERRCTPYTAQQRDNAHHTLHNRFNDAIYWVVTIDQLEHILLR